MPSGASIGVSQVEMCVEGGHYIPDGRDVSFVGKSINVRSGSGGFSNHATIVGQHYFGVGSSPAREIRSADIYEANAWINCMLRVCSTAEPAGELRRVQNHSWVGSLGSMAMDVDALRRVDLMVQRDGVVVAAGLNNGGDTPVPRLMCSAYNVLAVGLTNAQASRGPVSIDGCGRVKPDLVAPLSATSWATPVVAASAALLLESLESRGDLDYLPALQRRPARAMLVKALLMGGATKTEWPDWRKGFEVPRTDGSVPLDYRYGAGELNIDNSCRILAAGERKAEPAGLVPATGWDFNHLPAGGTRRYFFHVPASARAESVSIMAVWNRQVEIAPGSPLRLVSSLANIDLRLYSASGRQVRSLVDASTSRIDNVEHIYLPSLPPGQYAIDLRSDSGSDYCLTWDMDLSSGLPRVQYAESPPPLNGSIASATGK